MDGFSRHNKIQIRYPDQHKTTFTTPWGTFSYCVMPFSLKNTGATFQCAMLYAFHDLTHIILAYLDDLTTRSRKCHDHLSDIRRVFERFRQLNIRLNPHRCVLCIPSGRLLDFIVSKNDIQVDPMKVCVIAELPPPCTL